MPTYLYRCRECHFEFEAWQRITEPPLELCTQCGGKVERVISGGAGLIFKGNGFYITDYRSQSYKQDAKKDQPASGRKSDAAPSKKNSDSSTKP